MDDFWLAELLGGYWVGPPAFCLGVALGLWVKARASMRLFEGPQWTCPCCHTQGVHVAGHCGDYWTCTTCGLEEDVS